MAAAIAPIIWQVESLTAADGTVTEMGDKVYTLKFRADGSIGIRADCNVGTASYTLDGDMITITQGISTLVACEDMATSDAFWAVLTMASQWGIATDASDQLTITASDGSSLTANPTVTGVVWQWKEFQSMDDTVVVASDPAHFTLQFNDDGSVQAQVDCNTGRGDATIEGSNITLVIATTRKLCSEDSQDSQYLDWLSQATSFVIRGNTLNLALPMDSGIMVFEAVDIVDDATPAA